MRLIVLATVVVAGIAAAAGAQSSPSGLAADLEKDWTAQKARMVALAEAMPADKYEFRATPPQRTYAEQLLHLAEAHVGMFKRLDAAGKVTPPTLGKDHGREAVIKAVTDSYDYGLAVIKADPARDWTAATPGGNTAARTVWSAMNLASNHYGQLVAYLRLNGIVPPASRR
jgi:uncharacterized damage-inducible protein DinB